jgi:hypothetical protein
MKKLLFAFFLLPLFSLAQDCAFKKETDPITNEPKMVSGFVPFNASGIQFSIAVEASAKEINLFFLIENPSPCFNDQSTAIATFAVGRSRVNLKNNAGGDNCQGIFQTMYRNASVTPANLDRLSQNKIGSFQFKANPDDEKVTSVTLNEAQQQQLTNLLQCISKEAKAMFK